MDITIVVNSEALIFSTVDLTDISQFGDSLRCLFICSIVKSMA